MKKLPVSKIKNPACQSPELAGRQKSKIKIFLIPSLFIVSCLLFLVFASSVFAQNSPFPTVGGSTSQTLLAQAVSPSPQPADGSWVPDSEVTFVGKVGARAGAFLDWTLQNYNWSYVTNGVNPLATFWATIRNIVYAFIALFVLITAFILIVTRGKNITIMKFIPRFILIILLVTFSFALTQFIYQIIDVVQGFFLRNPDVATAASHPFIWQGNLLYIGFDYQNFLGYRIYGTAFDESAFISLLLVKLTAITYYVMVGILLLRKIILWFFIIISPIFPLLLLYSPIRNTAKVWIGEFFRWLLYAPIFSIFLSGLVYIWRSGIPLKFNFIPNDVVYPTAINILLGGPGQTLSLTNSVNNSDTFAEYIVALLMLWVVIILPFLLLQIFLDYMNTLSVNDNAWVKQLVTSGSSFMGRGRIPPPETPPLSSQPAGMARSIPFTAKVEIPEIRTQNIASQIHNLQSVQSSSEILRLTNLSVPTMQDIAKYETASISSDISRHMEIAKVHETLESIANPTVLSTPLEKERYTNVKEKLVREGQKGNYLATSILSAANTVASTSSTSSSAVSTSILSRQQEVTKLGDTLQKIENPDILEPVEKQKLVTIKEQLVQAQKRGDPLATSILTASKKGKLGANEDLKEKLKEAKERGNSLAADILHEAGILELSKVSTGTFPVVNRVQSVSLDDYESVKKMWSENYQKLEPPKSSLGKNRNRKEWVSSDIDKINETINLLVSSDPQNVKKGMESVGTILPFLLIGGFSQTEVIAYLKAKLEAAKQVFSGLNQQQEEDNTTLQNEHKTDEKPKEMSAEEDMEDKSKPLGEDVTDINNNQ